MDLFDPQGNYLTWVRDKKYLKTTAKGPFGVILSEVEGSIQFVREFKWYNEFYGSLDVAQDDFGESFKLVLKAVIPN